ncbi:MAG: NAD(P)H-hydrate dehydratase [Candidatus Omnitrophota bacterium]
MLQRKLNAHKGDFGHVLIIAGSSRFSGAAVLCAEAALRCGSGLVTLGIPKGINSAIIKIKPKEVMTLPLPETKEGNLGSGAYKKVIDFIKKVDILVVGPGLGQEATTKSLVRKLVAKADKPLVIDADGLNALAGYLNILESQVISHKSQVKVLTPHSGEMARLVGISVAQIQANRGVIAKKFAKDYKVIIVLKGHNTVVTDYQGNFYINKTGNPGMATAGSGDVLSGIIAAFLAQGLSAFEAAKYAVYLHGLSGDLAAKEKTQISLIASDIIAKIPEAVKSSS